MSYIAPVHLPTSIRHALRIRFLSPDAEDLIVAKANRLEIWRLTDEGMSCLHTKFIYGTISMLQRLQPKDSRTDLLFIGTDRLQYFNVAWNAETNELDTVEQTIEDTAEQYMRNSQSQNKCLVDPTGKFMAMHLWEGVLNVFRLPTRRGVTTRLVALDQVRLTELWMKASTFLHSRTGHPRIAFLYKSQLDEEEARIAVYRLTKDDMGADVSRFDPDKDRELDQVIADPYASMLIPVPVNEAKRYNVRNTEGAKTHLGGLLVVGETLLTYFDSLTYSSVSSPLHDPKIYVAWAEYDGTNYLLADDYGQLDLLTIETAMELTGEVVTGMTVSPFTLSDATKVTARASALVYMGNDRLFVASHHGDSQLLHINLHTMTTSLMQSLSNNAPILDFAIMDMGNREGDTQSGNAFASGQARIVAGCGAYHCGSLRSIRSGVGLKNEGILDDIQDTSGLFTLKSYGAAHVDTLVAPSIGDTRVFRFDSDGGIEEVYEFQGLAFDQEILLAANVSSDNSQLLQVTQMCVTLLDAESGVTVDVWDCPEGKMITTVSANSKWVLLSVDGSTLVSLDLNNHLAANHRAAPRDPVTNQLYQISCLHAARDSPEIGIVGWWTGAISIVELATLKLLHREPLRSTEDSASVPRDLAFVQLHPPETSGPTLLVALEDGNLITFNISPADYVLSTRKCVTLGSSAARLHILPQDDGTCSVFATTEHASLIYSAEGRIVYSATVADNATYVAPFDSEAYPNFILISTDSHIRLCRIEKERLTHVRALPMKETVRRLAYSPTLKAFGLGCIKKELVYDEEVITSSFRLVDEIILKELGKPFILDGSPSLELVEAVIRAELPNSAGIRTERFIVGTSFITGEDAGEDDIRGRILVLGVDEGRQVYQIISHKLKGACRCLGVMGEHIVAGLSKTVVVFSYLEKTTATGSLQKIASYRPGFFPVDLDISGNTIGVVDLMQSLSLLEFFPAQDGSCARLEEKARHNQPGWATSVCHLDGERWLETDAQGNIIVLEHNEDAPVGHDCMVKLQVTSEMNIGEQINRIRRLHIASTENAIVSPKAFLGSIEGTLYLYGDITPSYQDLLITLQARLQDYIYAPGNISFDLWRAFRNESRGAEGPVCFIDGQMIERFLDLDEEKQGLVCEGLGPSVEDMRNMIEELRRMH